MNFEAVKNRGGFHETHVLYITDVIILCCILASHLFSVYRDNNNSSFANTGYFVAVTPGNKTMTSADIISPDPELGWIYKIIVLPKE